MSTLGWLDFHSLWNKPQATFLYPALSCAADSIFLQLYLKTSAHIPFTMYLFQVFFGRPLSLWSCVVLVCRCCHHFYSVCVQGLPTLVSHRTEICTSFFNNSVLKKNSCLYYLLPRPRREEAEKLRRPLPFVPQTARTTRFQQSYMIYALNNYQI